VPCLRRSESLVAPNNAFSSSPSNTQKSPARIQCEQNAANQLEAASQQVSWSAVMHQLPKAIVEGAAVGAVSGCAAGAAATS
jgi:hypothetical protein